MVLDLQLSLREMMMILTMLGRDKKQTEGHKVMILTLKNIEISKLI